MCYQTSVFFNTFVQDNLLEDVYISLLSYFESDTSKDRAEMVMIITYSHYGLVQDTL